MSSIAAHVRVLNSLLFIKDATTNEFPVIDGEGAVWSTPSCVAVGCLPDCDGATEVIMGDRSDVRHQTGMLLFDASIETPSKVIVVQTVLHEKIMTRTVPTARTHVRIWTDGNRDTDKVVITLA